MVPRDRWEGAAVVNCLHADGAAALAHAEGHPKGSPATCIIVIMRLAEPGRREEVRRRIVNANADEREWRYLESRT